MSNLTKCGIAAIAAYVPMFRLKKSQVALHWGEFGRTSRKSRSVGNGDEDAATMAIEAAIRLIDLGIVCGDEIDAIWVGSETKPYAANPTATKVAAAIGANSEVSAVDLEFACRGAIEAIFQGCDAIAAGTHRNVLVIGSDNGTGSPSDVLETDAGSAAVAFLLRHSDDCPINISHRTIECADLPDFHRRDGQKFPIHAGRFTGEPGYFAYLQKAADRWFKTNGADPGRFRFSVFHQPNQKFASGIAKRLGFTLEQYGAGLFSNRLGNPYAANVMLGLAQVLPMCSAGDEVFIGAFGSGAGADCFSVKLSRELPTNFLSSNADATSRDFDYATYLIETNQIQRS